MGASNGEQVQVFQEILQPLFFLGSGTLVGGNKENLIGKNLADALHHVGHIYFSLIAFCSVDDLPNTNVSVSASDLCAEQY
jgi:hypothetical protein